MSAVHAQRRGISTYCSMQLPRFVMTIAQYQMNIQDLREYLIL